jgi:hypothetical protein
MGTNPQNVRLANLVRFFHSFYMLMYIPIGFIDSNDKSLKWLYELILVSAIANLFGFLVIRIHWGPCPLTMLEDAYRNGEEQNGKRWKEYRKSLSFNETCKWMFFNTLLIWFAFQMIGIFIFAIIKAFT